MIDGLYIYRYRSNLCVLLFVLHTYIYIYICIYILHVFYMYICDMYSYVYLYIYIFACTCVYIYTWLCISHIILCVGQMCITNLCWLLSKHPWGQFSAGRNCRQRPGSYWKKSTLAFSGPTSGKLFSTRGCAQSPPI